MVDVKKAAAVELMGGKGLQERLSGYLRRGDGQADELLKEVIEKADKDSGFYMEFLTMMTESFSALDPRVAHRARVMYRDFTTEMAHLYMEGNRKK